MSGTAGIALRAIIINFIKQKNMKKIIFTLLIVLQAIAVLAQDDITVEGKHFRSDIMQFLREEGFTPSIDDEEHDLRFKKEGKLYWMYFYNSSPIYVQFYKVGENTKSYDEVKVLKAVNKANVNGVAKAYRTSQGSTYFLTEAYFHSSEEFKYVFYKYLNALDDTRQTFIDALDNNGEGSSNKPFSIYACDVANVKNDGTVISDYGKSIYSSSSRYIKSKIDVNTNIEGSYDIYIKFITPTGMSSGTGSPSGYSFKQTIDLKKSQTSYILSGWGSDNAGHWTAGSYRMEFYYQGDLLYTKDFTVY